MFLQGDEHDLEVAMSLHNFNYEGILIDQEIKDLHFSDGYKHDKLQFDKTILQEVGTIQYNEKSVLD